MSFRLISVRGDGVSGGVITSKSVIGGVISIMSVMPVSGDVKSTIFVSAV